MLEAKFNEEAFECKLHPDENVFHQLVQEMMQRSDEGMRGLISSDHYSHSQIVGKYAFAINDIYQDTLRESTNYGIDPFSGEDLNNLDMVLYGRQHAIQHRSTAKSQLLQRDLRIYRAERDLWTLLETLSYSNLLIDLDDTSCERNLTKGLTELPISATILDYLNAAYRSDDRFRKGGLLKEWIENASMDRVSEMPIPKGEPCGETLTRILRNKRNHRGVQNNTNNNMIVQSLHPDAQLLLQGNKMLSLDGVDRIDQESSLKMIWQLLRSGQLERAKQICADHRLYWLTASLQGAAINVYKSISSIHASVEPTELVDCEQEELIGDAIRFGNIKQPFWTKSCWKYADRLAIDAINKNGQISNISGDTTLVGLLEMSIYACLSNNIKVLLNSPLLSCWHDKLWVYLKATHERDISLVFQRYRLTKSNFSSLYPGCDINTIRTENQTIELSFPDIGHLSTGTCVQIFNKIPPPSNQNDAEILILSLQAAIMEGKSGILNYLENVMSKCLQSNVHFPGKDAILRISCHLSIWLKYAPINDIANLSEIISDDLFHCAVESYINHLIHQKQRSLVAVYAAYLSRPRRIVKYAQLLKSMQLSSAGSSAFKQQQIMSVSQTSDAADVLNLAKIFFPDDVIDITRSLVENMSDGVDRLAITNVLEVSGATKHLTKEFSLNMSSSKIGNRSAIKGSLKPRSFKTQSEITFVKKSSLSVTLTSSVIHNHALRTKHSTLDLSGNITNEDKQKMDSLRWLFFDPIYRLEAIKQSNRLIIKFLLSENTSSGGYELKVAPVRALLADYIPLDSIDAGYAILENRKNAIDDEDMMSSTMLSSIKLEGNIWTAQVAKLQLWTAFTNSLQDLEVYRQVVTEYETVSGRLLVEISSAEDVRSNLGKFRSKIIRTATIATDSFKDTIVVCAKSQQQLHMLGNIHQESNLRLLQENVADGYKEIWKLSEISSREYIISNLQEIKAYLKQNEDQLRKDDIFLQQYDWVDINNNLILLNETVESLSQDFIDSSTVDVVDEISYTIHELQNRIASLINIEDENSHLLKTPIPARKSRNILATPTTVLGTPSSKLSNDLTLPVITSLKECYYYLLDIKEGKQLAAILLTQLLSSYIQTCLSTAAILESLSYKNDAIAWYGKVIQLAELIASEDHSLQLYSIVTRDDLEALLLSISSASLSLLAANTDFTIL